MFKAKDTDDLADVQRPNVPCQRPTAKISFQGWVVIPQLEKQLHSKSLTLTLKVKNTYDLTENLKKTFLCRRTYVCQKSLFQVLLFGRKSFSCLDVGLRTSTLN